MLFGFSNILKRQTREGRQESKTADQDGAALDLSDGMAQTGEIVFRQVSAAQRFKFRIASRE